MDLAAHIREAGGVVRTSALRRHGWSNRAITSAFAGGEITRPRKGWAALPEADPALFAAARGGVVLSCVTQARRLGLWVLGTDVPHVAASPHAGCVRIACDSETGRSLATVHWAKPVVPRVPAALTDPVENVLAVVATCRPFEEALAIWESALNQRLVQLPELQRLPFTGRAREVLAQAQPFSDSGLESFVPVRLAWLRVSILPQAWLAGHRVDFLIGERLVLQIDGGTHVGAQRTRDIEHDAQLMLMGYHVVRVGYEQVVHRWPEVQGIIQRAVAQGLHLARCT